MYIDTVTQQIFHNLEDHPTLLYTHLQTGRLLHPLLLSSSSITAICSMIMEHIIDGPLQGQKHLTWLPNIWLELMTLLWDTAKNNCWWVNISQLPEKKLIPCYDISLKCLIDPHEWLLQKLNHCGIHGQYWCRSRLTSPLDLNKCLWMARHLINLMFNQVFLKEQYSVHSSSSIMYMTSQMAFLPSWDCLQMIVSSFYPFVKCMTTMPCNRTLIFFMINTTSLGSHSSITTWKETTIL